MLHRVAYFCARVPKHCTVTVPYKLDILTLMKKITILLLAALFHFNAYSQKDSAYFDLGINTVRLLTLAGNQSASSEKWINPYLLHAEGHIKFVSLRLGFGIQKHSSNEVPSDVNGNTTYIIDTLHRDFRIGVGLSARLSSKWTMKYGLDAYFGKYTTRRETQVPQPLIGLVTDVHEIITKESGVSPFLFFQYHFGPRISLGTELLMRFGSYTTTDKQTNSSFPGEDTIRTTNGNRVTMIPGTALFLTARF